MMKVDIFMAAHVNKKMRNKILSLHAAWLFQNGYYDESIDCLNEATDLKRTGVHVMPRASLCTSIEDPRAYNTVDRYGAFVTLVVRARRLGRFV